MVTNKATVTATKSQQRDANDGPLLDSINAAVKKMIALGKQRGFVTYDELNAALPSEQVSSEQIEDTMSMLSESGVNVIENEESEVSGDSNDEKKEEEKETESGNFGESDVGRSDDPVRMYLREMGSVELLSREGEIAIAKRIEAGREMMIGGIVESPMTIRSLLQWRKDLDDENMLLRDIIDLDATFTGPKEDHTVTKVDGAGGEAKGRSVAAEPTVREKAEKTIKANLEKAKLENLGEGETSADGESIDDDDDDDADNSVSLAVMEQTLLPIVLEKFDQIKTTYAKLNRAQEKRLATVQSGEVVTPANEKRIIKLRT
jgi:RNA polymerase primary sigma factor